MSVVVCSHTTVWSSSHDCWSHVRRSKFYTLSQDQSPVQSDSETLHARVCPKISHSVNPRSQARTHTLACEIMWILVTIVHKQYTRFV